MASLAELQDALMNADKAGDTAAATQLADAIHSMRSVEDAKPAAAQVGGMIGDIGRQVGLTARYGLEGLANTAQIATEPIRYIQDKITPDRAPSMGQLVTGERTPKSMPLGALATQFADRIGLPSPQGANERTVGEAARLMAGAGGLAKGAQALAGAASPAANTILSKLGENVGTQVASAAGSGLAGGAAKEGGLGFWGQLGASVGGGLLGGMSASGASKVGDMFAAAKRMVGQGMTPQEIDAKINIVLQRAGVDYSQVPERLRQGMRAELRGALETNKEVSPQATARLLDFQRTGTTPTRGMLSQNPVQITREQNLAKIAANTSDDSLHGLPLLQNQNNARLIANLNEAGANRGDMFRAGERSLSAIGSQDAARMAAKDAAYRQLESMPAYRNAPIAPNAVSDINRALEANDAVMYLPKEISSYMESFLQPGAPAFTVSKYNNLQKMLSNAATSTDGNVRWAAGVAMGALENAPVRAAAEVPGAATNRVASAATEAIDQLQTARRLHRDWRTWQESARPITAAVNNAQPDKFVQNFVIGGTLADARAVAQNAPVEEVKNAIVAHLKEQSIGKGARDEYGKFSQSAYNKALDAIGPRKLALFFSPEEIAHLQSVGRAASAMQVQPIGSAVNNSNSGALVAGKALDWMKSAADKVPFGNSVFTKPVNSIEFGLNSRNARNIPRGLLVDPTSTPLHESLLLPGMAVGGLLAAP